MGLIPTDDRQYLEERFGKELEHEVKIELFTRSSLSQAVDDNATTHRDSELAELAEACQVTEQLFAELATISLKIILEWHDLDTPSGEQAAVAANINPEMLPAFQYKSAGLAGTSRYFGMPTGFEFGTLIETISDFSRSTTELSATTQQKIKAIDTPLEILIFVTPTCGYCPAAVRMANQAAMLNSNLSVAVIEANEFNDLANSYYVYGVPRTVINEKTGFDGAVSEAVFVTNLERAVKAAQNQQEISPKA